MSNLNSKLFTWGLGLLTVVLMPCVAQGQYFESLVIQNTFDDGTFGNSATGPSSAGAAGDAGSSGPVSPSAGTGVGGGGSAFFADGANTGAQLIWGAAVDVIGPDGATFVLDFQKGDSPDLPNAPGWLFNHDSNLGQHGSRIQSDGVSLRARSPAGFYGGGAFTSSYHRVVQTIRPVGGGLFESEVYLGPGGGSASPAGTSGTFAEMNSVTVARVGAAPSGFEVRLSNAHVDNVMVFDIGMTDAQVAGIPTNLVPEPTTGLLACGLGLALAARRRRRG